SLLLAARDEHGQPLTDQEVRDELVSLLVAGHETVAGALGWVMERILLHPGVHERLVRDRDPEYLDAVIRETLRQRPGLGVVARRARKRFRLGRFDIPAGTFLAPSICLTHMRPDLYPQPERFDPERFLSRRPDAYEWIPFGGGGRRCIGMMFALFEMKTIVST